MFLSLLFSLFFYSFRSDIKNLAKDARKVFSYAGLSDRLRSLDRVIIAEFVGGGKRGDLTRREKQFTLKMLGPFLVRASLAGEARCRGCFF